MDPDTGVETGNSKDRMVGWFSYGAFIPVGRWAVNTYTNCVK